MAGPSRFSPEQLDKIRATLQLGLGDDSADILESLENRFGANAPPEHAAEAESGGSDDGKSHHRVPGQVNVARIIQEEKVEKMLEAIPSVRDNPANLRALIVAILQHGKAFHMVDALSKVRSDVELVNALVHGIINKTGVNPLIDALRYAGESQLAMQALAHAICKQGTIQHIIRAIATVHKNPEVSQIWALEVMGKGNVEQMLEALNLIDKDSNGPVILVTGIVSNKESSTEQLIRALQGCKENPKALAVVAVELAKRADTSSMVTLLDKYVSDSTDAGEIVVAKLVNKGRPQQIADACKHITSDSNAARILAWGVATKCALDQLLRAHRLLTTSPMARQMVGLEIVKKRGKLMAMKDLGSEVWDLVKNQAEIEAFMRKSQKRLEWVLKNQLGEEA
ncbi:MAG: hypothetical protein G8345_07585 [Magnetococcales bacterium]|nr:hypothetical protein [Magnetococcales bacterium]NGZ26736.1 hypothetical protein [Magnetococcales bacterium]